MKRLSKCLIVVGVIIILIPFIGRFYVQCKEQQLYENYLQTLAATQEQAEIKDTQNKDDAQSNSEKTEVKDEKTEGVKVINTGEVIGKIEIKKADIDLILLEGDSADELKLGAGHMQDTAYPGETGNCVIAGHRNYTFGSMFNRLDEIEVGDEVKVEFEGQQYKYIIEDKKIVEPDDVSVLEQNVQGEKLTLITCHPVYTGTHRLIIEGELQK